MAQIFMTIVYELILFSGAIAGDEGEGTTDITGTSVSEHGVL
jgi:hypothetical protein